MDKNKLITILEGAIVIALGILIAIFGAATVLDTYFGIVAVVLGAILTVVGIVALVKKAPLPFGIVLGACVAITIGVAFLTSHLSIEALIHFIVFVLIGLGGALALYGIYTIIKGQMLYGIIQIVVGAVLLTLGILFITVPDFQQAFWIITGIVVALYGAMMVVSVFLPKKD